MSIGKNDIYSKDFKKYVIVFVPLDSSHLALSNHPKINVTNQFSKSKFNFLQNLNLLLN